METNCFTCGKKFETKPARLEGGRGKYCSMACRSHQRKHPAIPCPTCGVMFHPNKTHGIYCSRACMPPPNTVSDPIERFWSFVDKTTTPDGCWTWTGHKDKSGYGKISVFEDGKWKTFRAHKYAAELITGKLPDGVHALHHCDNPPCVRYHTKHVFTGTQMDNMRDKVIKGRQAKGYGVFGRKGESINTAKLTEEKVREIKRRLLAGEAPAKIAPDFGVTAPAVFSIKNRRTWKHVV